MLAKPATDRGKEFPMLTTLLYRSADATLTEVRGGQAPSAKGCDALAPHCGHPAHGAAGFPASSRTRCSA